MIPTDPSAPTLVINQSTAILRHLKLHGSIMEDEARDMYGVRALRSRISDLRKSGVEIGGEWVLFTSRYGNPGRIMKYIFKTKR